MTRFGRLICFDQRGSGLSNPVALDHLPTLEVWMDDNRAVMEAAGSRRAVLVASGGGSAMAMTFAATYPETVHALVITSGTARYAPMTDYPYGTSQEFEDRFRRETAEGWGRGVLLDVVAPSRVDDLDLKEWWGRYQRLGSSPGTQFAHRRMLLELDIRDILPSIRVPTPLIHRTGNRLVMVEHGRYLAAHIPGSRLVEIPGSDYFLWLDATHRVLEEIGALLGGRVKRSTTTGCSRPCCSPISPGPPRSSPCSATDRGTTCSPRFAPPSGFELTWFRGVEVDIAGDGFLARFDGPARAIRCAAAREATRPLGIELRTGLHTGDVESSGEKVSGLAVHIGARVAACAVPGETLVSSTVKDLVAGSGLRFEDRGPQQLKGVPDPWRLFATESGQPVADAQGH